MVPFSAQCNRGRSPSPICCSVPISAPSGRQVMLCYPFSILNDQRQHFRMSSTCCSASSSLFALHLHHYMEEPKALLAQKLASSALTSLLDAREARSCLCRRSPPRRGFSPPRRYGGGGPGGRRATPPARGLHMFVAGLNFITNERVSLFCCIRSTSKHAWACNNLVFHANAFVCRPRVVC